MAKHNAKPPKVRMHKGNHPSDAQLLAVHPGPHRWHLYRYGDRDAALDYWQLKLVARVSAPGKANWWLAINPKSNFVLPNKDMGVMYRDMQDMVVWIQTVVQIYYAGGSAFAGMDATQRGAHVANVLGQSAEADDGLEEMLG